MPLAFCLMHEHAHSRVSVMSFVNQSKIEMIHRVHHCTEQCDEYMTVCVCVWLSSALPNNSFMQVRRMGERERMRSWHCFTGLVVCFRVCHRAMASEILHCVTHPHKHDGAARSHSIILLTVECICSRRRRRQRRATQSVGKSHTGRWCRGRAELW